MSPKAFTETGKPDPTPHDTLAYCPDCTNFYWVGLGHACSARPVGRFWRGLWLAIALSIPIWGVLGYAAHNALARSPKPQPAPTALLRARAACPDKNVTCLLGALRNAYQGLEWAKKERLDMARQMLGNVSAWSCIHRGEGAWNSHTGNGYYGGLQMDAQFERTYGRDMLQRYHAHADQWKPRDQIIVAQRAFVQGRGYAPWPNTSHACGLR